jgi:Enoyl-CoA hydratase/isomerase
VREWPGKDINWFRTFVAEVNLSYRAIEALRVPTIAAVQGVAFGGGFELALNCDFIVAADNTVFRCVEVTTGMLPIAGALQRLAERIGRGRASRFAMLGEPISNRPWLFKLPWGHVARLRAPPGITAARMSAAGKRRYRRARHIFGFCRVARRNFTSARSQTRT